MKKFLSLLLVLAIMFLFSACGANGKEGETPTIEISDDGYWIINGVKTEHKAIGTDGKDGKDGEDVDSITSTIAISDDGYWIINGIKTAHKAIGTDGKDGKDAVTPTIEISDDGYWVINGEKSNIKAIPEGIIDENPQGLDFYLQDDGTYIVSCGNAKYLSKIVIPATYKSSAVVGICPSAFRDLTSLIFITIPDSVTSIDHSTFYGCTSLASVVIENSVISIGDYAFYGCESLEHIQFVGTVEQWNAISFGEAWNYNVPVEQVFCSDGVVPLK